MFDMSDNYYLRKHFLESNQVPTQSLIKKKMTPPLADVYFKSMNPRLKALAGLEPPLKGAGGDWYVPPKDLLEGRSVLKPLKKKYLSKLNCDGIEAISFKLIETRIKRKKEDKAKMIDENDNKWKAIVEQECLQIYNESSKTASKKNTERINHAFQEFTALFSSSLTAIEKLVISSAQTEINKIRNAVYEEMKAKYEILAKQQATELYDLYTEKLVTEKFKLKAEFIIEFNKKHKELSEKLHDIHVEKHSAVEKVRQYLTCVNLACQIYVALKEKEECGKIMEELQHQHTKKAKVMADEILTKDVEIILHVEKEKKGKKLDAVWQKKIYHVVKKFQLFVTYCLSMLPEHAQFFINMEKLMLLQISEVLEKPDAESIFEVNKELYLGPTPKPHPFYLFCDKGDKYNMKVRHDLCPKPCSSSQMPVIVVNKRCLYAACDTFEQFSHKVKHYIHGQRGDDADLADHNAYEDYVPVKYNSSQQLLELELESSLLQVLQQEIPNLKGIPIDCGVCKMPYCFCSCPYPSTKSSSSHEQSKSKQTCIDNIPVGEKVETGCEELAHEREPKWESYLKFVESKKCKCFRTTKKHLKEHLPAYMRQMSVYEPPELPNYEKCSLSALKDMVKKARGTVSPPAPTLTVSKTRDIATQCLDPEFDLLCTCFSDEEIDYLFKDLITGSGVFDPLKTQNKFKLVNESEMPLCLPSGPPASLVAGRDHSLKNIIENTPELKDIFKITNTVFDKK